MDNILFLFAIGFDRIVGAAEMDILFFMDIY